MKLRKLTTMFAAVAAVLAANAAEPDGYYKSCENKNGAALLSALEGVVGEHTAVTYANLYNVYKTSDITVGGKIWDMYSTMEWAPETQRCGSSYSKVGDCYNREHSMPKSWFKEATPMYTDAFHVYPTDGMVNGQRNNYPYGECADGTTLPGSDGVQALGRLGTSTFAGYSGKVFEPDDKYKGDFARTYFYMAAAYNSKIGGWNSDMLAGNSYPAFTDWTIQLLLKWHRQDPVSKKERDRNEAVSAYQHNRNPFIDHPELAEYIWGDKKDCVWTLSVGRVPTIYTPVNGATLDLGTAVVGGSRSATVNVTGAYIDGAVSVAVSGAGFSASQAALSGADVCTEAGANLTVSYNAVAADDATGTLTLTAGDAVAVITLRASALEGLPATEATAVSDCSFVAHWTYVGDADAGGCYQLAVNDAAGNTVATYPRSVQADAEQYFADGLEPETTYTYVLSTASGLKSNSVTVTTKAPIPSIQMLYDGEPKLFAVPGEPSEAAEILLDIDNITTDITLSVTAPFALSSDKSDWNTVLTVDPREDRFYLRVFSETAGKFETSIKAVAGDYVTDEAVFSAVISDNTGFVEDFEAGIKGAYTAGEYQGTACKWYLSDAGVWNEPANAHGGNNPLRMGKTAASSATMTEDTPTGIATATLWAKDWGSDGSATINVDYSIDGGNNWVNAGNFTTGKVWQQYSFVVNKSGNVRLRLSQTAGKRVLIDDIEALGYSGTQGVDGVESDYHSWDAFCRGGRLVVSLADSATVGIYGVDGKTYHSGELPAGESLITLPAGLYIVSVADFTRRVLVK